MATQHNGHIPFLSLGLCLLCLADRDLAYISKQGGGEGDSSNDSQKDLFFFTEKYSCERLISFVVDKLKAYLFLVITLSLPSPIPRVLS